MQRQGPPPNSSTRAAPSDDVEGGGDKGGEGRLELGFRPAAAHGSDGRQGERGRYPAFSLMIGDVDILRVKHACFPSLHNVHDDHVYTIYHCPYFVLTVMCKRRDASRWMMHLCTMHRNSLFFLCMCRSRVHGERPIPHDDAMSFPW